MKTMRISLFLILSIMISHSVLGQKQKRDLDNYRFPDKRGIQTFEAPKDTATTFEDVHVRIGGASTLQFQAINHSNNGNVELIEIGDNFNLATANLDLDVELYDGVRMHLRTYLSSRHHPEPYVKGGYFQVDKLDFIEEGFLEDWMQYLTFKIGHMEINYGDAHFRRSDNASTIYNPFIGNYLMDAFITEVGFEAYYRRDGWIGMLGITNGKLNQDVEKTDTDPVFLAKFGYDDQITEDFRFRATGSVYHTAKSSKNFLYDGDRAGSRYYLVVEEVGASTESNFRSGRVNPQFATEVTSIMFNTFLNYKDFEFFGIYENSNGRNFGETSDRTYNHFAGELIYRFGKTNNFYLGTRYSYVDGEQPGNLDVSVDRLQLGAGWFMTKNILAKIEYVDQNYNDFDPTSIFGDAEFDGIMLEAVISF
ncbi:hypothetical protein [Flavobacterium sp. CS20]|uniref:hypothetical protein n=1 Tax=Flavobacterium sp. CS20 TaxID=2775246 RepID=UPI001B3A3443|nr:hypothetical protein [Flavobacterium sp. CS20]QTY26168.1 hypothetical protein IGB25_09305 [Flavobacterium sp. CS20]